MERTREGRMGDNKSLAKAQQGNTDLQKGTNGY